MVWLIAICVVLIIIGFAAGLLFGVKKTSDITRTLVKANEGKNKIISIQNRIIEAQKNDEKISNNLSNNSFPIVDTSILSILFVLTFMYTPLSHKMRHIFSILSKIALHNHYMALHTKRGYLVR